MSLLSPGVTVVETPVQLRTPTGSLWRGLWRHREGRIGLLLGGVLLLVAAFGPLLTADPNATDYANQLQGPSGAHWLGTDRAGRDLVARTVAGAQASLGAALLVMAISTAVGLLVGVIAGSAGGAVDAVLTRITDILLGLPGLVMTLALVGLLGPGFVNLVLAMSISSWAGLARLARAVARSSGSRPDVLAARMAGAGRIRIAVGHVLPAAAGQVLVAATLGLGEIVLALGGLSFLGLGAQPPTAEWGNMLASARETLASAPHQLIGPGLGLVLTVLAATLVSDALRDVTDLGNRA
ncbi:ABC transporter permease [Nakamurella leprariae]|uniref:ABC transporter permease n=1 Tax=Nakamurella leprariae TaxID=2803911 RepID=A0A938YE91_9ACTN|nr:ABC transporter permease [Nakamurella leprariae]MBM9466574.1 ABC transporter permease [Nakamurella leprariae]